MKDDKLKSFDRLESLKTLAIRHNCHLHLTKSEYFKFLISEKFSAAKTTKFLQEIKVRIIPESIKANKDPEDTTFGILYEWTQEFLDNKVYEERNRTYEEICDDFYFENKELLIAGLNKDENKINEYLNNNMDKLYHNLEEMTFAGKPAERYRVKAIKEKDVNVAIQLINKGLELDEKETTPFLYDERAECYIKLKDYQKALEDVNLALNSLINDTNYFLFASRILGTRVKIRRLLNDNIGEAADKKLIEEYEDKADRYASIQERILTGRVFAKNVIPNILIPEDGEDGEKKDN